MRNLGIALIFAMLIIPYATGYCFHTTFAFTALVINSLMSGEALVIMEAQIQLLNLLFSLYFIFLAVLSVLSDECAAFTTLCVFLLLMIAKLLRRMKPNKNEELDRKCRNI